MKILFKCRYLSGPYANYYRRCAFAAEGSDYDRDRYEIYLCCLINDCSTEVCDYFIGEIDKVIRGEVDEIETGVDEISITINPHGMQIDLDVSDEFCDQPEGRFTLQECKNAFIYRKKLLSMPETEESFFIAEI